MLLTSVEPSRLQSLSWLSSSKQRPNNFKPCQVSAAHPISYCRVSVMSRLWCWLRRCRMSNLVDACRFFADWPVDVSSVVRDTTEQTFTEDFLETKTCRKSRCKPRR